MNVNLSNINLSRLRLGGINLSEIKLGMPSGNRKPDPIPGLKGLIALYSGAGLTNEQMSQNPVWKDLSGNGHDLQMKNFAWNDQSGVNASDYAGAIVFDGVDDYGFCDNFPILTKEKGYTVMALRKWINKKNAYDGLISNKNAWSDGCAFLVEYNDGIKDGTISFNRNTYVNYSQDYLIYQTSEYYNGNQILTGDVTEGTNILNIGRLANSGFSQYSNFAMYALCIIDHDTSDAEREIVINKWRQYYPELL